MTTIKKQRAIKKPTKLFPQHQDKPGLESKMRPKPVFENKEQKGSGKLKGKVAIITGGDSGIGRAIAIAFAKEGADVSIIYLNEHSDAEKTKQIINKHHRKCLLISGNIM